MRSQERVEEVLSQLGEYWLRKPDLRLGQIIYGIGQVAKCEDTFLLEDDRLLEILKEENTEAQNEAISKDLLRDLETLSYDDMDEFDKYEYFVDNMTDKIAELCNNIINKK